MTANLPVPATVMLAPGAATAREAPRERLGAVAAARAATGAGVPVAVTPVTTGAERAGARILSTEDMEGGIMARGDCPVDPGREFVVARYRDDRWVTMRMRGRRA